MIQKFQGLMAATHTPFAPDGALNLAVVEKQAAHLLSKAVTAAFIGGSTGESHSLTCDERLRLSRRWLEVAKGTDLKVIVHAGSNCLSDARTLAAEAERLGAAAVAALAPSYYKPDSLTTLIECCAHIAEAAPDTPFYFYDIPVLTGVSFPMPVFLQQGGDRIPNLAGIKFTNVDFMSYQLCRQVAGGRFDILWGVDEMMLPALACGAEGAVGSTYNFAAPVYQRMIAAYRKGDMDAARAQQLLSVRLVQTLARRGYMASAKALMSMQGVDVGPPRLPHRRLGADELDQLREELAAVLKEL